MVHTNCDTYLDLVVSIPGIRGIAVAAGRTNLALTLWSVVVVGYFESFQIHL